MNPMARWWLLVSTLGVVLGVGCGDSTSSGGEGATGSSDSESESGSSTSEESSGTWSSSSSNTTEGTTSDDGDTEPLPCNPAPGWTHFATGTLGTWGRKEDGTQLWWGFNARAHSPVPVTAEGDLDWIDVAFGDPRFVAISQQGELFHIGDSGDPVLIGAEADSVDISGNCALREGGQVICWTWDEEPIFSQIEVGPAAAIGIGWNHGCARLADGALWCWGENRMGQLGDGTTTDSNTPVQVGTDSDWDQVAGSEDSTCATRMDGTLWCWGFDVENIWHQSSEPVQIGTDTDWTTVTVGWQHACALKPDHTLWCWGRNEFGEVGTLDWPGPGPTMLEGEDWVLVEASHWHTCALKEDSTLWCWGRNDYGQVGNGEWSPADPGEGLTDVFTPVQVCG